MPLPTLQESPVVNQPQLSTILWVPMWHTLSVITTLPQEARVGKCARWSLPNSPAQFQRYFRKLHGLAHSGALPAPTRPAPPILDHPCVFPTSGGFSASYLLTTMPITALPLAPPPQRLSEAAPFVIGISLMKKGYVSLITVTVSESTSELIYLLSLGKTRSSIKKFTFLLPVAIKEPVLF